MRTATLLGLLLVASVLFAASVRSTRAAEKPRAVRANLAPAAAVTTSFVSGHETLSAVNDGFSPKGGGDHDHGCYGNWPRHGTQWAQYEWAKPVGLSGSAVYWWDDHQGVRLPAAARLSYWNGSAFVPLGTVGVKPNRYNAADFPAVTTTKLRLEMDAAGTASTGVIEWQAFDDGTSPAFPPTATAGPDRVVVRPAPTFLRGTGNGIRRSGDAATGAWAKATGPGDVAFADAASAETSATFSTPGTYTLTFTYTLRGLTATDTLHVRVEDRPTAAKLSAIYASHYSVDSPFWHDRLNNLIVHWIPHCVAECEDPAVKEGGIDNFVEAGKKLRGEPAKLHKGYPFSNAWVLNTAEAMCDALTLDTPDPAVVKAQGELRAKLDQWIPILLAAQEPDGYLQTRFTLGTEWDHRRGTPAKHWDAATRTEHEGYVGGYFIELGIAHYVCTGGRDRRLFDAAVRLADCWCDHLGPGPKRAWFDGHQEMEQALVRLGRFVDDVDGAGRGRKYVDLAKFLLDCRRGGSEYDQSYAPITHQYRAVGHAVRAAYTYSAMADLCMQTNDPAYWSATLSIWDDLVDRKLYVTGGIGSGETSEGFGDDYSLPTGSAYCESCSNCGLLFMQHKLNLATRDAKYADVYETAVYNAILGDVDLAGENFTYTNALDSDEPRYKWHVCPCCVGNIPRTLLMLPTWTYAKADEDLFVNLFVGGTVDVGTVAGADVRMTQRTNYPWDGKVAVTVNPATPARFTVHVRSPVREVSALYTATPAADGITAMTVNGQTVETRPDVNGYVSITRLWTAGDTVAFEVPLPVQVVTADARVKSTRGRVALRRGPLIYNVETADGQNVDAKIGDPSALTAAWSPDLLGGVMAIRGQWADGSPLTAVPNYARLNRGGRSVVWVKR